MHKALLGLLIGALLGAIDGASAWFYPEVHQQMMSIVLGSTAKGLVAGLITGFVARKLHNLPLGMVVGLLVAALITWPVAHFARTDHGEPVFWEIMIPGAICGMIVGFATQRYGAAAPATVPAAPQAR